MENTNRKDVANLTGFGIVLAGISTFCYQVYYWLQNGEWLRLSLIDVGKYAYNGTTGPDALGDWIYYPTEWIGVHALLDHVAITIFAITVGIIIIVTANSD